ncbi:MAG: NHLP bacteriocin export ABC transporter permease/ATPase subunit [Spirochaetales bacterium]|nr:NHLP bacteriocin export ABC transporter permease/ATPase subunit [Spirochaetales bacterium]
MSWFDEQIKQRKEADDTVFSEANRRLGDVVSGRRTSDFQGMGSAEDDIGRILGYFHIKPKELPQGMNDLKDQMEFLLRPSGIMTREIYLEKGWHKDASGPMLGFLKESRQPCAIIPARRGGYEFFDESTGKKVHVTASNEKLFDEDAIVFYKPLPLRSLDFKDVLRFHWEAHTTSDRVMFMVFLGLATLIQLFIPRITKIIFSTLIYSDSMRLFFGITVFLLSMSISSVMFTSLKNLVVSRINNRCSTAFEASLVMRLLQLPVHFFRENSAGILSSRMYSCRQFSTFLGNLVYSSVLTSVFSLIYIGQIIIYAPTLAPIAVTIIILQIALYIILGVVSSKVRGRQLSLENKESSLSYSTIFGIQKIKLVGAEKRIYGQWANAFENSAKALFRLPAFMLFCPVLISAVGLIGQIFLYSTALSSSISLSDYYAFNSAYGLVNGAIMALASVVESLTRIGPLYAQIKPVLEAVPEVDAAKKTVSELKGKIKLEDVCFRYDPTTPNIVDHLNLTIDSGEYLAIVGRTGCGKSTVMRLLLGFEKPDSGLITYDGADLQTLDLRSLRQKIGVVLQDGKLFNGDIYSNIVISAPWLTEEEAWEAAKMAGLEEDIKKMPMGMHTMINSNSGGVSGGQRQRIMIARAIASKPRILLFDEATSALDNVTQKIVSDSLSQLKCTRIVIAHRLSTIRQCDRIIMLDGGHIVEDGTYDQLMELNGVFADMVARQQVCYDPME